MLGSSNENIPSPSMMLYQLATLTHLEAASCDLASELDCYSEEGLYYSDFELFEN